TAHLPERPTTPGDHEAICSWGLRELTTTVVRHSGAGTCCVSETGDKRQVTDDDCGLSDEETRNDDGGVGERRERDEAAGGQLIVRRDRGLSTVQMAASNEREITGDGATSEEEIRWTRFEYCSPRSSR